MYFHGARFIRGDLPSKPIMSHTGDTHRGGAYIIEASRASVWHEVPVTSISAGGEAGINLKPGSYSGGTHSVSGSLAGLQAQPVVQPGFSFGWLEL